jgi:hypothetical protein
VNAHAERQRYSTRNTNVHAKYDALSAAQTGHAVVARLRSAILCALAYQHKAHLLDAKLRDSGTLSRRYAAAECENYGSNNNVTEGSASARENLYDTLLHIL